MLFKETDVDFFPQQSDKKCTKGLKFYVKDSLGYHNIDSLDFIFEYNGFINKDLNLDKFYIKPKYKINKVIDYLLDKKNIFSLNLLFNYLTYLDIDYSVILKIKDELYIIDLISHIRYDNYNKNIDTIDNYIINLTEILPEFDLNSDDIPNYLFTPFEEYTEYHQAIHQINYINKKWEKNEHNIIINSLCKYIKNLKVISYFKYGYDIEIDTGIALILHPFKDYTYNKDYKFDKEMFYKKVFK
jgi:hypothetical protein